MPIVVVTYSSVLYRRTGLVGRWAHSLERRFVLHAKAAAPKRSGELAGGISGQVELSPGAHTAEIAIFSAAPHTKYVVGGTTGPIMSRRMWGYRDRTGMDLPRLMRLPGLGTDMVAGHRAGYVLKVRAGKGFGQHLAISVSGQDANNFFAEAARRTAVTNPSLRGFSPSFRL